MRGLTCTLTSTPALQSTLLALDVLQVAEGADVGLTVDPAAARAQVLWPWAHVVGGQAQYELLMGVIWCVTSCSNCGERCDEVCDEGVMKSNPSSEPVSTVCLAFAAIAASWYRLAQIC